MTDDPDADRPPPARPIRVAGFDGLGSKPDVHPPERRVADVDGSGPKKRHLTVVAELDSPDVVGTAAPVAEFEAVDGAANRDAPVASLDAVGRRTPTTVGPSRDDGPRAGNGSPHGGSTLDTGSPPHRDTSDDAIPPDRPLPRGRRRGGRGGRVGRLGPDAPDPEVPEPTPSDRNGDPVAVAREICLRLLTDRARTRQELAQALARKGVPGDAAATVLDRFDEVGLIDDAAFAGQWVRSRHERRGLGRRAIAVELRRKGVADDVAGEALAEVDAESEARRARELVDRKLRSIAVDNPEQRTTAARRLVGMLARKGYGAGVAYRVVREALAEHGAEIDELGVDQP